MKRVLSLGLICALAAFGCDDAEGDGADMGGQGGQGGQGGAGGQGGEGGVTGCDPEATDYPGDAWAACVSDGGEYVLAGDSPPSSIGRVAAFEQMGDLLWAEGAAPSPEDFIEAQIIFADDEGIGSRVGRRYDSHVPKPEGANCREAATATPYPEYCVGPAQMLPIINGAFDAGALEQGAPAAHAARIEAALLWFLYVSTYKEASTCFGTAKDCDSAWAYFGAGATVSDGAAGLGERVRAIDAGAYATIFDALLAVRCWRDLDDGELAEDEALFEQARGQLDTALDHGYSRVIIDRLEGYAVAEDGAQKDALWAGLEVLGGSIDRAARARDAGAADRLAAIFTSDSPDAAAAISELEILFPCP